MIALTIWQIPFLVAVVWCVTYLVVWGVQSLTRALRGHRAKRTDGLDRDYRNLQGWGRRK